MRDMRATMTKDEFKKYVDSLLEERGGEVISRRKIADFSMTVAYGLKSRRKEFKNDPVEKIASLIASVVQAVIKDNALGLPELDPSNVRFSKN